MSDTVRFIDRPGASPTALDLWPSIVISKETIDAEIERLASQPRPANGRRRALIAHPRADTGNGLAPGIQVALDVLLPGERTVPYRQNSTQVNFVIRGAGHSVINGKRVEVALHDVWNTPSMHIYWHGNDSAGIQARLTYSNAALLEKLNVHYVEEDPKPVEAVSHEALSVEDRKRRKSPIRTSQLTPARDYLRPYDVQINPPPDRSDAHTS